MIETVIASAMLAGVDFPVTQEIGGNWNNLFWEGSFTVDYTETEIGSRFDYKFYLADGNIGVTDFEMTFDEYDFSYGFNLDAPGEFAVWSIEVPYTGYRLTPATIYNDEIFGSATVFNTFAPVPTPGTFALLGLAGFSARRRRR